MTKNPATRLLLHGLLSLLLLLALQGRVLHAWTHVSPHPETVKEQTSGAHQVCELCLGFVGLDAAATGTPPLPAFSPYIPQQTSRLRAAVSLAEKPPFNSRAPPYFS